MDNTLTARLGALLLSHTIMSASKQQRAKLWLLMYLFDGPKYAEDVANEAQKAGFSLTTVRRAQKGLVMSYRRGYGGPWLWRLMPQLDTKGVNEMREKIVAKLLELTA